MASEVIAQRILRAYQDHQAIAPVRGEVTGLDAAYEVQRQTFQAWVKAGRVPSGRKIGLTSKAVQDQLGVSEPDFGALFSDMILQTGAEIAQGAVLQPRVEPEVAFMLKSDLKSGELTAEDVLAATEYVMPAIEVCGSRIQNWDIKFEDTIADNASSGLVVLGSERHKPDLAALAAVQVAVSQAGTVVAQGEGSNCLGNPAQAVAWLANALHRLGDGLHAGDLIMSGAMAKMVPANAGDTFRADFGKFGSVSFSLGR